MSDTIKASRNAANPRSFDVTGVLPSGHPFTLTVSPKSGSRCTDSDDIHAWFDVDLLPDFRSSNDAEIEKAIGETEAMIERLDRFLQPLVDETVSRLGIKEDAVREVIARGLELAFDRQVAASEVDDAIAADADGHAARREAYLQPICQATWEEADEYERGMRF